MLRSLARRRLSSHRRRGQGLVEYGAVAAALTLVGLLGLQAITNAQVAYFEGLPMVSVPPSAPGALLHLTTLDVDPSKCVPNPVAVSQPIRCTGMVVRDIYDVTSDRLTPTGDLDLFVDGNTSRIDHCTLDMPLSDRNSCSQGLTWTPTATDGLTPNHTLTIAYSCSQQSASTSSCDNRATSNHLASSVPIAVTIAKGVAFSAPTCVQTGVDAWASKNPPQVELGHPIVCTTTATNKETGGPAAGIDIIWNIPPPDASSSGAGIPLLSCATNGDSSKFGPALYASDSGNPCTPASSQHCTTDAAGVCRVVYRLTRQASGSQVLEPRSQGLVVMTGDGVSVSQFDNLFLVADPPGPHFAWTWVNCTPKTPNVTVVDPPTVLPVRDADFNVTSGISVSGTTGSVDCTVTAIDTSPSAALDCSAPAPYSCRANTDPDFYDGHSPIGTATVTWKGQPATCSLNRVDVQPMAAGQLQPPNQTPYASACTVSLTLTGAHGDTGSLNAVFGSVGANPTHAAGPMTPANVSFD